MAEQIILNIKVTPNAGRTEIIERGEVWKVKIAAPPVRGLANQELITLLSEEFKVPKQNIIIVFGEKSRHKRIKIVK